MAVVRIDIPKGLQEGKTSVTPQSPRTKTTSSPPMSTSKKLAIGYGLLTARTSYQTIAQEVNAGGNEELATQMENVAGGIEFVAMTIGLKGLNVPPMIISEVANSVVRIRQINRDNRDKEFERLQRGNRVTFNQGRAYE